MTRENLLRVVKPVQEPVPFDTALADAANLLEMVGGGQLICEPSLFPVVIADQARLIDTIEDGYWPPDAA